MSNIESERAQMGTGATGAVGPTVEELEGLFGAGKIPTAAAFVDLIKVADVGRLAVGLAKGQMGKCGPGTGLELQEYGRVGVKIKEGCGIVTDLEDGSLILEHPMGPTGAVGALGPTGPVGSLGATGPRGIQGLTGASGIKGDRGERGEDGKVGGKGPVGSTGTAGRTGPVGSTGVPGPVSQGCILLNEVYAVMQNGYKDAYVTPGLDRNVKLEVTYEFNEDRGFWGLAL